MSRALTVERHDHRRTASSTERSRRWPTTRRVKALIVCDRQPRRQRRRRRGLHDAIAAVAAKKPVVAVMGGIAASAGYMIAVPAARIFARAGTLTGSIGVLLETGEVSGLLDEARHHAPTPSRRAR